MTFSGRSMVVAHAVQAGRIGGASDCGDLLAAHELRPRSKWSVGRATQTFMRTSLVVERMDRILP